MDSRESTERTLLAGTFLFRGAPREAVELKRSGFVQGDFRIHGFL